MKSLSLLTLRESMVCDLVILGMNNNQIAERLGISKRTVEDHRFKIFSKYKVRNAVELTRRVLLEEEPA